jgi:hypothetical protein
MTDNYGSLVFQQLPGKADRNVRFSFFVPVGLLATNCVHLRFISHSNKGSFSLKLVVAATTTSSFVTTLSSILRNRRCMPLSASANKFFRFGS